MSKTWVYYDYRMKKFCEALQRYASPDPEVLTKSTLLMATKIPYKIKESYNLIYKHLVKKTGLTMRIDNIPIIACQKYDNMVVNVKTIHVRETLNEVSVVRDIFLCKGCAFVWLRNPQDAQLIYNTFNGMLLENVPLKITIF